jgi:hypothetical protein
METSIISKLFEQHNIADLLPKIQEYVDYKESEKAKYYRIAHSILELLGINAKNCPRFSKFEYGLFMIRIGGSIDGRSTDIVEYNNVEGDMSMEHCFTSSKFYYYIDLLKHAKTVAGHNGQEYKQF